MTAVHILVMAKAPVPGRVKTRLCPALTSVEAAALAETALADTLQAVAASSAERRLLALDGEPGPWLPSGFEVVRQVDGGLDERLVAAWDRAGGPGIQIGMDTPQVTAELLDECLARLVDGGAASALGLATDGGWWAIGLRRPDPAVFLGVPMSKAWTGRSQLARLRRLGLDPVLLPRLRDVDLLDDIAAVAALAPRSRFGIASRRIMAEVS